MHSLQIIVPFMLLMSPYKPLTLNVNTAVNINNRDSSSITCGSFLTNMQNDTRNTENGRQGCLFTEISIISEFDRRGILGPEF